MPPGLLLRVVTPVASAALAFTAGLLPVPSARASQPGWPVITTVGPVGGASEITSVASTSARDAWAVGAVCAAPCTGARVPAVEHWTGTAWTAITPPALLTRPTTFVKAAVVGASSGRNAWVFVVAGLSRSRAYALHWDGGQWTVRKFPASSDIAAAVVFSRRNAWAFGTSGASGKPYDVRFNGSTWHKVSPPGNPSAVSAVSARDMWAIGPTMKTASKPLDRQSFILMHWAGHAWHSLALPRVRLPAGDFALPSGIVALGPMNVWEDYSVGHGGTCCTFGGLEHWNGVTWHRVAIPYAVGSMTSLVSDGHRGLWMLVHSKGYFLYHYSRGRWSRRQPPGFAHALVVPGELAWVRGTRSVWAGGSVLRSAGGSQGMIWASLGKHDHLTGQHPCPRGGRRPALW